MANVKVPIWGTVGKAVSFDPQAGARALAAVEALAQAIDEGLGSTIAHRSLQGLQVGDDHPQYTMWQAPETIEGLWNFQTVPNIQGETLAEYIEEVVGGSVFDFLQDTTSVVWTYHDTANELEANVPPEFVQDTVGAMLLDSTTVDLSYNDLAGTLSADVITSFDYAWTGTHTWADSEEVRLGTGGDLRLYHDGTNSIIRNDTGVLRLQGGANIALEIAASGALSSAQSAAWTGTHTYSNSIGVRFTATTPTNRWRDEGAGSDEKVWDWTVFSGDMYLSAINDAETTDIIALRIDRSGQTPVRFRLPLDSYELQIGASQDLRLYHDGTNSHIHNDTGNLVLTVNGELDIEEVTTGTTSPAAGGAGALPATPAGYVTVVINGNTRQIPYY